MQELTIDTEKSPWALWYLGFSIFLDICGKGSNEEEGRHLQWMESFNLTQPKLFTFCPLSPSDAQPATQTLQRYPQALCLADSQDMRLWYLCVFLFSVDRWARNVINLYCVFCWPCPTLKLHTRKYQTVWWLHHFAYLLIHVKTKTHRSNTGHHRDIFTAYFPRKTVPFWGYGCWFFLGSIQWYFLLSILHTRI